MRAGSALCIAVLLVASASAQQAQKAPLVNRNAFTFLNWHLDLRIETETQSLFARGTISARNDSEQPQRVIALQLSSSLKWASMRENGEPLPFSLTRLRSDLDHTGNVEEALVTLPSAVSTGASIELEIGYSGTVSLDATRLAELGAPLEIRAATDYDRITPTFTCLRGVGHVLWFPVALDPALLSDGNRVFEESGAWSVRHSSSTMSLTVKTDLPMPVYTNAQSVLYESQGQVSIVDYQWKHLGIAGPALIAGNYQQIAAHRIGQPAFTVNFLPERETQAQDYARVIRETLPTVSGKSNIPAHLIDLPESSDSAFEADAVFLTPLKTIDQHSLELTLAYQFAHQTLWSPRAWIYEGAAHFAQALMRERQDGRATAIAFMEQRLTPLLLVDTDAPENTKRNNLVNATSEVFFRTKAMYVWWMLRELVGQRALLDSLQQYDPEADKEPSYIQKLLEKNSHKDLEWFFDDWIYQDRGLPEFIVSNGYARPSLQGIYLVSATIENKGSAAAEVPVIVHTVNGDVPSRLRVAGHSKAATRVEVSSRPVDITINDGSIPETDRSDNTTPIRIGTE